MEKEYRSRFEMAMAHCISYANKADELYRGAENPREVVQQFFAALQRHRLVGDVHYASRYQVSLPDHYPHAWGEPQADQNPNTLAQDALDKALNEFYGWHLERMLAGPYEDPWYLHLERQAVRDFLSCWERRELITYNLDYGNAERRGVSIVRTTPAPPQPRPRA